MKYLLDTHVFLWSLFDTSKLSKSVKDIMLNENNDLFVSSISFWEISLKYSIGKLKLENVKPDELPLYAEKSGFEILNFDELTAAAFYKLPCLDHFNPFDRMIIWQSINSDMIIISKDEKFKEYIQHGVRLFWS
ncbi:MAG: type II toxin-antitoxin system VapC family toxin [Spirochaetes bacterium]|nr:type II toxin-antitoxin system VapC family toxin [Spirochaetota bacterium]